jgi:phage shock protein A
MATLFQKLRTLFRANLHELADRAIEKSDLAVYDDFIRQAERALETFKKTINPMIAQVATTRRRREALADQAAGWMLRSTTF